MTWLPLKGDLLNFTNDPANECQKETTNLIIFHFPLGKKKHPLFFSLMFSLRSQRRLGREANIRTNIIVLTGDSSWPLHLHGQWQCWHVSKKCHVNNHLCFMSLCHQWLLLPGASEKDYILMHRLPSPIDSLCNLS